MENIGNSDLSSCVRQAKACGMKTLLRRGADPDARDHHGMTALSGRHGLGMLNLSKFF